MANSIRVRADGSGDANRTLLFYETSSAGIFDGEESLTGTSTTTISSELDGFRLVSVPTSTSSSYGRAYFSTTTGNAHVTNTDYGMLTWKSDSSSANRITVDRNSYGCNVNVTDEHGTNVGTPSIRVNEHQFFGVKHKTTSSGYVYKGVRITLATTNSATIISTGYTRESQLVYTFPVEYEGAIILQSGSSGTVYIEFLYSNTYSITLDANGGMFPGGSSTHTDEVQIGSGYTFSLEPTYDGRAFRWWKNGGTVYNTGDSFTPESDMVFMAVWGGGPSPRPGSQKDYMVYSAETDGLIYSPDKGALVYAV